jgi:3-phenylpropionate/trans-cinnamate dioxygenase ferredoxin subunit
VETTENDGPDAVTITVSENGPYEVHGPVTVFRADGTVLREGERLYLCRCGQSAKKPYCDNTHKRVGFVDPGLGPEPTA